MKTKNSTALVVRLAGALALASAALPALAVGTLSQTIVEFRHDGNSDYVYVTGAQPWVGSDAPGCGASGAIYAWINPTLPGRKTMVATLMMARAAGAKVSFLGNCSSAGYLEVSYIIVAN